MKIQFTTAKGAIVCVEGTEPCSGVVDGVEFSINQPTQTENDMLPSKEVHVECRAATKPHCVKIVTAPTKTLGIGVMRTYGSCGFLGDQISLHDASMRISYGQYFYVFPKNWEAFKKDCAENNVSFEEKT